MTKKTSARKPRSRPQYSKGERYTQTLIYAANGFRIKGNELDDALNWGLSTCLRKLDKDLLWSLGLALTAATKPHYKITGKGLLFSAALAGHDAALNNLSIALEQKGAANWHRQLAKVLLEIAAKNGDPTAMWNMYYTYKRSNRDRALSWLLKARSYNDDYENEVQRLIKIGMLSPAKIRSISKVDPW